MYSRFTATKNKRQLNNIHIHPKLYEFNVNSSSVDFALSFDTKGNQR